MMGTDHVLSCILAISVFNYSSDVAMRNIEQQPLGMVKRIQYMNDLTGLWMLILLVQGRNSDARRSLRRETVKSSARRKYILLNVVMQLHMKLVVWREDI
jgi:hypothetical protein